MTIEVEDLQRARSVLAVPGHRPDRFSKAAGSGADVVMLDLEDSVGADLKEDARNNVEQWLATTAPALVRINAPGTAWFADDIAMVAKQPGVVVLPKITEPAELVDASAELPAGASVVPLIETAAATLDPEPILAQPGVVRAMFGNADLGTELGIDPGHRSGFCYARAQLVMASAAAGIAPPIDGVTLAIGDQEQLLDDTVHAEKAGFTGKLCLHPGQVGLVNEVFTPSAEDLEWARSVLGASRTGSVTTLSGAVVGRPIIERARRLLAMGSLT